MEKEELLERYEALGDEHDFLAAKPLYEQALAEGAEPRVLNEFGYLSDGTEREYLARAAPLTIPRRPLLLPSRA